MTTATTPRKLVEGKDYLLTGTPVSVHVPAINSARITKKILEIYSAKDNAIAYLCAECKTFTGDKPRNVVAHMRAHSKVIAQRKADMAGDHLKVAAFDLLPAAMQRALLARAKTAATTQGA